MSQLKENKWKAVWQKLRIVYRLQLIEEKTYDVKFIFRLTLLNVITVVGILIALFTFLNFIFIATTPLKQYIPGYGAGDSRKDIINLRLRTEELEDKIDANNKYNKNLKNILSDKIQVEELKDNIQTIHIDTNTLVHFTPNEQKLVKEIEKGLRNSELYDNLLFKNNSDVLKTLRTSMPVHIKPIQQYKNSKTAFATIYSAKSELPIKATLSGTIIDIEPQDNNTYSLIIQHNDGLVSKYKNIKQVTKKITNFVEAEEEIGKTDANINLEYELWYKGIPINVEKYY